MKKFTIDELYQRGLIGAKPKLYMEIFGKYKQYRGTGLPSVEAVGKISRLLGVNVRTVYRAINACKGL